MIRIGDGEFGRSAAGLVYGGISLVVGETTFPDLRWTDFVVVVLTWWCRALQRILRGDPEPIEVRFMEGPYLVELQLTRPGFVQIALVEAGLRRRVNTQVEVEIAPLVESLLGASDRTLLECRNRSWWSPDADELLKEVVELKLEARGTV